MNKIELCKKCKNRKFDFKRGILCGLTDEKPTFEINCPHFEKDETVKEYKEFKKEWQISPYIEEAFGKGLTSKLE